MFDSKKYKQFALIQLKNRWTVPVFITVLIIVLGFIFSIPKFDSFNYDEFINLLKSNQTEELNNYVQNSLQGTVGEFLMYILQGLVTSIIMFSANIIFLKMSSSQEPVMFSSFVENLNYWFRAIKTYLLKTFWIFIWLLIPLFLFFIGSLLIKYSQVKTVLTGSENNPIILLISCIFFILCLGSTLLIINKLISYSQLEFIAAEFTNISVSKALEISKIITQKHKLDLVKLYFSFIVWMLLILFTFGIAELVVLPYFTMTKINAYHSMLKEALENKKLLPEDLE